MGRNRALMDIIGECLAKGVAEGDVDPSVEQQEIIDLLMAAYVWVYRLAAWHDADAETMTEVMDRQIGLIAQGFRPRSSCGSDRGHCQDDLAPSELGQFALPRRRRGRSPAPGSHRLLRRC